MLLQASCSDLMYLRSALALSLLLLASPGARVEAAAHPVLTVASAANLRPAMEALAREFEREHPGVEVVTTYGASGALVAQIRNGAPFDLFLSADREYPQALVEAGMAVDEVVYANGALGVWLPAGSGLAVERRGLAALSEPEVRRIAIANPAVAPYGRAAEAALRDAGVLPAVRDRLVLGQSVSQAAQFAQVGAVDAAILPMSLATTPELTARGRILRLPPERSPRIEQSAVVVAGAREPGLARAFLAHVLSERGRATLARHGYGPP